MKALGLVVPEPIHVTPGAQERKTCEFCGNDFLRPVPVNQRRGVKHCATCLKSHFNPERAFHRDDRPDMQRKNYLKQPARAHA